MSAYFFRDSLYLMQQSEHTRLDWTTVINNSKIQQLDPSEVHFLPIEMYNMSELEHSADPSILGARLTRFHLNTCFQVLPNRGKETATMTHFCSHFIVQNKSMITPHFKGGLSSYYGLLGGQLEYLSPALLTIAFAFVFYFLWILAAYNNPHYLSPHLELILSIQQTYIINPITTDILFF